MNAASGYHSGGSNNAGGGADTSSYGGGSHLPRYAGPAPGQPGSRIPAANWRPSVAFPTREEAMRKPPLGKSRACCCFICTQDASHSFFLSIFVLLPTCVFTTSVVPLSEWYSIVICWVLTILALIILVFAVGIDPGIVPPASVTGQPYDPDQEATIEYKGTTVTVPVCRTCLVPRPPKSSHCGFCDYCVEEYDHHCGVLGSCVAKRTFRFFAYFFDVTTLLAGYVFVRSCIAANQFNWSDSNDSNLERWYAVAIIGCIGYSMLGGCCVAGQALFYTKLACEGTTQKQMYGQHRDPIFDSNGVSCGTYVRVKCGPLGESRVSQYV